VRALQAHVSHTNGSGGDTVCAIVNPVAPIRRTFDITRAGPILVVRWNETPHDADFAELDTEVATARELAGRPLVYVTVLGEASAEFPPEPVRGALLRHLDGVSAHCRSCEIVMERVSELGLAAVGSDAPPWPRVHGSLSRALSSAAPRAVKSQRP
jgi:hypothetical protein